MILLSDLITAADHARKTEERIARIEMNARLLVKAVTNGQEHNWPVIATDEVERLAQQLAEALKA